MEATTTRTPQEVFEHHGGVLVAGDLDGIVSDYADDAIFITPEGISRKIRKILEGGDVGEWSRLITNFNRREEFDESRPDGFETATAFLIAFGARQLIHGHTPIAFTTGALAGPARGPRIYAHDLCVNIDGGLFLGDPGFVYQMEL